mmetsp:Transcript_86340/g.279569  ORF Transcript_86340/g.279569 Transcript_86340/m.279569 type:complete len:248 (+) Transcript_86340:152-895(+)
MDLYTQDGYSAGHVPYHNRVDSFETHMAPATSDYPEHRHGGIGCTGGMSIVEGFGDWNELIAGGLVDRSYIEREAERRKEEIDRATDNHLAQLETRCQEQCTSIRQQAEYHTQMAEKQIRSHMRQHQLHITRQAEIQAYAILQRAEQEKARLGQEAARALSQQSEREKAVVLHEATRKAEDVWRQSQRALLEQAQRAKAEIDMQAAKRTAEIEQQVRQAVSRVYISPHSQLAPAAAHAFGSFPPAST